MRTNKERRMKRIFQKDGKSLVVAMDHGSIMGPIKGIEKPEETIRKVLKGGCDAIMTTFGIANKFSSVLSEKGLILRVDGGITRLGLARGGLSLLYSVEDALRIGADAVISMAMIGSETENKNLSYLARLSSECEKWRMPLLAEALPPSEPKEKITENIKLAVRVASEFGADFIKAPYSGTPDSFKTITHSCFVPILILGGPQMGTTEEVLTTVREAVDAGAAGVCMGRNIWQHEDPAKITSAIRMIIHENASVEDTVKSLDI